MRQFEQETCMLCYKAKEVRHIKVGSKGFLCCKSCEDRIQLSIESIRREERAKRTEYSDGMCMMCHGINEVRHVNLYPVGSEGLFCCRNCEDKLIEFIREERYKAAIEKRDRFKKLKEKGGDKI